MAPPLAVRYDAIIVAGGRATRLGGVDKSALTLAGQSLLDRVLDAASGAREIALVGPAAPSADRRAHLVREDPLFSGPAAAIGAGLDALASTAAPWTVLLAVDLVHPDEALHFLLRAGAEVARESEGVIAVDENGRHQYLLALVRTPALAAVTARRDTLENLSLRSLLSPLSLQETTVPSSICADVDTPADAQRFGVTGTDPTATLIDWANEHGAE